MICPNCGFKNRAGEIFCANCGDGLVDHDLVPTKQLLSRDRNAKPSIMLQIRGSNDSIKMTRDSRVVIGRIDPKSWEETPDLDLNPYGADEYGVSRIHAALESAMNPPMLVDMGSANGTFVNGQKLVPHHPSPLRSGDEIRLGRLVARVYFK
jgi:pSer/pThr/pTyr-binding forkhead associated (FHA) protein